MTLDPGAFRFEAVYEAIAPDGSRTRIGSFAIAAMCVLPAEMSTAYRDGLRCGRKESAR